MTAESISLLQRLSWIINIIFHQAVAVIVVYILCVVFVNEEIDQLRTWHMVFTPLGIMLLMMESLMLYMKDNICTIYMPRTRKHYIHSVLQISSTIFITVGIAFKISSKSGNHFDTVHGVLGLVTWILIWCSLILGIGTSQAQTLKNLIPPVWMKLFHTVMGLCGYTMGIICLCFGMKNYFKWFSNEDTVTAAIVAIAILYVWSVSDAIKSLYSQIRSILHK